MPVCCSTNAVRSSKLAPPTPRIVTGCRFLSLMNNLAFGMYVSGKYLLGSSFSSMSTTAMVSSGSAAMALASCSQRGFMFWHAPHHAAEATMKTWVLDSSTSSRKDSAVTTVRPSCLGSMSPGGRRPLLGFVSRERQQTRASAAFQAPARLRQMPFGKCCDQTSNWVRAQPSKRNERRCPPARQSASPPMKPPPAPRRVLPNRNKPSLGSMASGPSATKPRRSRTFKCGSPSKTTWNSPFVKSTVNVTTCQVFANTVLPHVVTLVPSKSSSSPSSSEPSLSAALSSRGISKEHSKPSLPVIARRTSSPSYGMVISSTSTMCSRSSPTKNFALCSTMSAMTSMNCLARAWAFKLSPPEASFDLMPHSPDVFRKPGSLDWLPGTTPTWKFAPSPTLMHHLRIPAVVLSVLSNIEGPSSHFAPSRPLKFQLDISPNSTSKLACTDRFNTLRFFFCSGGRSMPFQAEVGVRAWCSLPATLALRGLQPFSCLSQPQPSSAVALSMSSTVSPFLSGFLPSAAREGSM
mmetsp:Transcript_22378/g.76647  ORF Transcript_22378/g.76647 Transcript_22378/m.76647 type:complete len:521 (-) Transcript_22378:3002-4564(-)